MISIGIENFLMIQQTFIKFDDGLTVISGESGSGKSTIIDALCWCIGIENKRTKKVSNAFVTIQLPHDKCIARKSDDSGKSIFFINQKRVFKRDVLAMINHDIIICRQDNRLSFSLENDLRETIDEMIENKLLLLELKESFERFKFMQNKLNALNNIVNEDIEYIKQAIHEISELNLQGDDEDNLITARREQIERLKSYESLQKAREIFMNENTALISQLTNISKCLNSNSPSILDLQQRVDNVIYELQDVYDTIDDIVHNTQLNEDSIHQIDTKLSKIRFIAKKYRVNSIDLIELKQEYENKLHISLNLESEKLQLTEELKLAENELIKIANIVNDIRMSICGKIAYDINSHLRDMKMNDITMQFIFKNKSWTENGNIAIQLHTSNHRILSGGEMSRLLLAIKIATAKVNVPIIFDEIDIGVGGATAHIIGEKLKSLAAICQVIVVTHQAQVAAHSTHHILVSKNNNTATIEVLSNDSQVKEIARMISGQKTTNESIIAAKKLIEDVKSLS